MMRSLNTAATGMATQQMNLDIIANNLSNVNTTGFKGQHARFQDLMYQTYKLSGTATGTSTVNPASAQIGLGAAFAANQTDFSPGAIQATSSPLDLAINGEGFFQVQTASGTAYTRDGSFQRDGSGLLVTTDGYPIIPEITIAASAQSINISANGVVTAVLAGSPDPQSVGTIQLAIFSNPSGLTRAGQNLYTKGGNSGEPVTGIPGENGIGALQSNYLEGSNVQVVDEMVKMISAQRSYELNSKVIQASDQMLQNRRSAEALMMNVLFAAVALAPISVSVRVEGEGYLRFARDGRVMYATEATYHVTDGHLVATGGAEPLPAITIPAGVDAIQIDLEGNVVASGQSRSWPVGRLVLGLFPKGAVLNLEIGFLIASDRPTLGNPGDGMNGVIRSIGLPATAKSKVTSQANVIPTVQTKTSLTSSRTISTPKIGLPTSAFTAEIQIRPESIVPGETFTIGDIADIRADADTKATLSGVDLGRAPTVGVVRGIDANFLLSKIRTVGLKPDHISILCPNSAHLLRASQTVGRAQFLEAATAAAKDQLGIDLPLRLSNDFPDAIVPTGQLELRAGTAYKSANGIAILVDVRVDDKHFTSRNLTLAPTASAGIGVKMGDVVKIIVHLNGASIEIGGHARTAAWVGQTVTVITDTGAVKTGTVTGPNTVEIKL